MEMSVRWLVEMVEEMVMVVVKIVVVLVMVTFCPWGDVYQHPGVSNLAVTQL